MSRDQLNSCCSLSDDFRDEINRLVSTELAKEEASGLFQNFPCFTPRAQLARFLLRSELFKLTADIQGSIVECGVHTGFGVMSWHHLRSIYRPLDGQKRIIGFDTFEGFVEATMEDENVLQDYEPGDFAYNSYNMLQNSLDIHSRHHYLSGNASNYELIKGDACLTIPEYVDNNKHVLCSLLYLDFDVYKPTLVALQNFLPRMAKGSLVVFDQSNCPEFPGETLALLEAVDLNKYQLKKFSYDTKVSYFIV